MKLSSLLLQSRKRLQEISGLSRQAPEYLAQELFTLSRMELRTRDFELTEEKKTAYLEAEARLLKGEPLQYVLGHWEFGPFIFRTDARALIPREETYLLCEWAAKTLPFGCSVLDAGCGSGCIGIALKLLRRDLKVTLGDLFPEALSLARENAQELKADVNCIPLDIKAPWSAAYDCILSNPPYISPAERELMDASVLAYEPSMALFAGEDGYEFYRALLERARESLKAQGYLAVECGFKQAETIRELWKEELPDCTLIHDFNGIARIVIGRKR